MNQEGQIEPHLWRRFYAGWVLFGCLIAGIDASSVYMEHVRAANRLPAWEPILNEYSGALTLVALIPVIRWLDSRYPFSRESIGVSLPVHLLATVPFALAHVALFIIVRKILYPLFGDSFDFGAPGFELIYEYRKTALGYGVILLSLYGFRHYVQLRRLLDMPDASATAESRVRKASPQRFLAKRSNREEIVNVDDVRYFEAAGNYVILHTPHGELKLRETLANLEQQLANRDFVRVHRSYVVNLDAVREIQPWFHGDQRIVLANGEFLNLSRRYRDAVRERFSPRPAAVEGQGDSV